MNIIVEDFTHTKVFIRPDTSWSRKSEDLYLPDYVSALSFTPVIYGRLCRPGRFISPTFAPRYFDSLGYGILLYAENFLDKGPEGFAEALCLDHTSYLSSEYLPKEGLAGEGNGLRVAKDGRSVFETTPTTRGTLPMIEGAISRGSERVLVRTGDLVCVELSPLAHLMGREEGNCHIRMEYLGLLQDFDIIVE